MLYINKIYQSMRNSRYIGGQASMKLNQRRYVTVADQYLNSLKDKEAEYEAKRSKGLIKLVSKTMKKKKTSDLTLMKIDQKKYKEVYLNQKLNLLKDNLSHLRQQLSFNNSKDYTERRYRTNSSIIGINCEQNRQQTFKPTWYFEPLVPKIKQSKIIPRQQKVQKIQLKSKHIKIQQTPKHIRNCSVQTGAVVCNIISRPRNLHITKLIALKFQGKRQNISNNIQSTLVQRKITRYQGLAAFKKFKRVTNCILFTIYIKTFSMRMNLHRKLKVLHFIGNRSSETLFELKELLRHHSAKTIQILDEQSHQDYQINPKDDIKVANRKMQCIKTLVSLELRSLQECTAEIAKSPRMIELIYYICRHGSYACLHSLLTPQELNLICISEKWGYMSADKYLEMVSIVSFVLVKMVLYNIFFEREAILTAQDSIKRSTHESVSNKTSPIGSSRKGILNNRLLVGNVIYELCIDLQDWLLEQSNQIYKVSNWEFLIHRFNFQTSQNMTLKANFYQKNELISGLKAHKQIKDLYQIKQMHPQKQSLARLVNELHEAICRHHREVQQPFFLK